MASSTARALELLELLQSTGVRTVRELAGRLGIDERSVRRHIERLREIGIPVEAIRGRSGGYRIASSYRMPPLMLSEEEAVAVLSGLTLARGSADRLSTDSALATAIAKIRRSLPHALASRADALLDVAVGAERTEDVDPALLLTAADAIRSRRPLAMAYQSKDAATNRTLQPHDLIAYNRRWYLTGLDSLTREQRTFRLDRVRSLRTLEGTFPEPPSRDALGDLVSGFAAADYRHTVILRIQATADHIARYLPPSVARLEELAPHMGDDAPWFRATIRADSLDWLPWTLLALDRPVVVEQPDELNAVLLDRSARLAWLAGQGERSAPVP